MLDERLRNISEWSPDRDGFSTGQPSKVQYTGCACLEQALFKQICWTLWVRPIFLHAWFFLIAFAEKWVAIVSGCDYVLHIASPLPAEEANDPNMIIQPAVAGTKNVYNACLEAKSVKRLVVTGSTRSVNEGYTQEFCNEFASFVLSKMLSREQVDRQRSVVSLCERMNVFCVFSFMLLLLLLLLLLFCGSGIGSECGGYWM